MTFIVRELPKARADKDSIFSWLYERSPEGAFAWLDAYDGLIARLNLEPLSFGIATENADCEFEVRQALFKTRRGRVYRVLFFVENQGVFILRVRGPGQATVDADEIR
jgi:hypothetical protein